MGAAGAKKAAAMRGKVACVIGFNHHKSVGLRGGHRDLFMIGFGPRITSSERSTLLNKFGPTGPREAQVQYLDGDFRVVTPGTFVRCAVTDARDTAR